MKDVKVKCIVCKETRFVSISNFNKIKIGKYSGRCKKCSIKYRIKDRSIICPICKKVRVLKPAQWCDIKRGKFSGNCSKCCYSKDWKLKISKAHIGKKHSVEHNRKMSEALKGRKHTEEAKRKMSEAQKGEKGSNWKGGITPKHLMIRMGIEYRLWREAVFTRDNWTCQKCEDNKSGNLNSHHIHNFADYPELRTSIENGITLCEKCHKEFHKIYNKRNNTKEQMIDFLNNKFNNPLRSKISPHRENTR